MEVLIGRYEVRGAVPSRHTPVHHTHLTTCTPRSGLLRWSMRFAPSGNGSCPCALPASTISQAVRSGRLTAGRCRLRAASSTRNLGSECSPATARARAAQVERAAREAARSLRQSWRPRSSARRTSTCATILRRTPRSTPRRPRHHRRSLPAPPPWTRCPRRRLFSATSSSSSQTSRRTPGCTSLRRRSTRGCGGGGSSSSVCRRAVPGGTWRPPRRRPSPRRCERCPGCRFRPP